MASLKKSDTFWPECLEQSRVPGPQVPPWQERPTISNEPRGAGQLGLETVLRIWQFGGYWWAEQEKCQQALDGWNSEWLGRKWRA